MWLLHFNTFTISYGLKKINSARISFLYTNNAASFFFPLKTNAGAGNVTQRKRLSNRELTYCAWSRGFDSHDNKEKNNIFIHSMWFERLTRNFDLKEGPSFQNYLTIPVKPSPHSSQSALLELFTVPFPTVQWDRPDRHGLLPNNIDKKACVIQIK